MACMHMSRDDSTALVQARQGPPVHPPCWRQVLPFIAVANVMQLSIFHQWLSILSDKRTILVQTRRWPVVPPPSRRQVLRLALAGSVI